jgi:pyruvate carboxylase subunit A
VRGLQAIGYRNAGTVEFLLHRGRPTFNEVNARLQVEHPITEMVSGVDLVREQLRIAAGDGLGVSPSELRPRGHAIECRINAEDPLRNFLPSPGRVTKYAAPSGPSLRVDSGVTAGSDVPPHYDSLVAKLVAHGRTRDVAIRRMRHAVDAFEIHGVQTTLPFHRAVLREPSFVRGDLWTTMVADLRIVERLKGRGPWEETIAAIAAALAVEGRLSMGPLLALRSGPTSGWALAGRRERFAEGGHAVPSRRRW